MATAKKAAKRKPTAKTRPKATTSTRIKDRSPRAKAKQPVARRAVKKRTDIGAFTVKLSTMDDYPHNDVVMAEVSGRGADKWADNDQYIAGSSWETPRDMPNFAYAMPVNHDGLVAELRKEGYKLDLSEYEVPEKLCKEVGCTDRECGWH